MLEKDQQEPFAETWIRILRNIARCDWCGADGNKHSSGLCDHCDRVRKNLLKTRERVKRRKLIDAYTNDIIPTGELRNRIDELEGEIRVLRSE